MNNGPRFVPWRHRMEGVVALGIAFWLGGCAGTSIGVPVPIAAEQTAQDRAAELRSEIDSWLGTPHRLGGLSRRGIDCSGLVMTLYDQIYGIRLPRTTVAQMRMGQRISRIDLEVSDLVFFKPRYMALHVGVYLGGGQFVHVSSRRGVTISNLTEDFWRQCYFAGRRLLPLAQ